MPQAGEELLKRLSEYSGLPASTSNAESETVNDAKAAAKRKEHAAACALFEEAFWASGQYAHLVTAANMRLKIGEPAIAVGIYEHILAREGVAERLRGIATTKLAEAKAGLEPHS
eukprot:3305503-Prymnesium_polylepis.1